MNLLFARFFAAQILRESPVVLGRTPGAQRDCASEKEQ
jgi:hypothetical protein